MYSCVRGVVAERLAGSWLSKVARVDDDPFPESGRRKKAMVKHISSKSCTQKMGRGVTEVRNKEGKKMG